MFLMNSPEFMKNSAIPNLLKNIGKRLILCQNWLERLCLTFLQPTLMGNRFRCSNIAGKSSYSTSGESGAVSCLAEMPNVKRVYDTYKDQGFDIIGVNLDTDERRLRNYLKENDIQWRQIFSGQKWKSPLVQQYHIRSIPAPCLIARDGTLISSEARGVKLEQLVVEALKDKTENE